ALQGWADETPRSLTPPRPSQILVRWLVMAWAGLGSFRTPHDTATSDTDWEEIRMRVTRRTATWGGLSLFASTAGASPTLAELGSFLGIREGMEDFWLATDAYIL